MDESKETIQQLYGVILRKNRVAAGLSQEQLALLSGLDRTYISLLERGLRNPTLNTLLMLGQHLNVPASKQIKELEGRIN